MQSTFYLFIIHFLITTFIKVAVSATINTVHSSQPFEILGKYNQLLAEKNVNGLNFSASDDYRHHDYTSMTEFLTMLTYRCGNITRLHSIGESVQRRSLWVMTMANESITQRYSPQEHVPGMLEFKYIANMHGNEVVSREILLHFLYMLCVNYGKHELITAILDTTRIHVMPSMNPDGYEVAKSAPDYNRNGLVGRANARSVDLNRNFPDRLMTTYENARQEPETLVVMSWLKTLPFVLSANLHGGSVVANYPFDGNKQQVMEYTAAPDDDVFRQLALSYSHLHPRMTQPFVCRGKSDDVDNFAPSGITNGAAWYPLTGGMQDWNYLNTNCFELTLEVSCVKFPKEKELSRYWNENRLPLIYFLFQAHKGVRGSITQPTGRGVQGAVIEVQGLRHSILSAENGDYWRLLSPGQFSLTVTKLGFVSQTVSVNISSAPNAMAKEMNVKLSPVDLLSWSKKYNNVLENGRSDLYPEQAYRSWDELHKVLEAMISPAVTSGEYKVAIRQWQPAMFLSVTITSNKNRNIRRPSILLLGSLSTIYSSTVDLSLLTIKYFIQGIKLKDENVLNLLNKVDIIIVPTVTLKSASSPNQPENFAERQQCPTITSSEKMNNIPFHLWDTETPTSPLATSLKQLLQEAEPDLLVSLHTGGNLWRVSPDSLKAFQSSIQSPWLTHPTSIDGSPGGMKLLLQSLYKSYSQILMEGGFSAQQEVGCYHWQNGTGLWKWKEGADLWSKWEVSIAKSLKAAPSVQAEDANLSLLDYAYLKHGTAAVGIHVACCLEPPRSSLPNLFRDHLPPLLDLFQHSAKALCGKLVLRGQRKLREYEVVNVVLQIRGVSWSLKQSSWESLAFCKILPKEFFENSALNPLELRVFNVAGYQSQVITVNTSMWSQHDSNIWIDIPLSEKNMSEVDIHSGSYYAMELNELNRCSEMMKHYGYSISFKTIGYSRLKQKAIQMVIISPIKRSLVYDPVNIHFLGNIHSDSLLSAEIQWQLLQWFCSAPTMYWIQAGVPTNWYFLTPEGLSPERLNNLYDISQHHKPNKDPQCQTIPTEKYYPPITSIDEEHKIYSNWAIQQSTPLLTVSFVQSNQTFLYSSIPGFSSPFSQFHDSLSGVTKKNDSCLSQLTPQMLSHYTYSITNVSVDNTPIYSNTRPYYVAFSPLKSCCVWLPREQLVDEWINMKDHLKTFLLYSAIGGKNLVLGRVVSNTTRNVFFSHSPVDEEIRVSRAVISITGGSGSSPSSSHSFKVMSSDTRGSFAILLAPGTYQLSVDSEGHAQQNQTFTVNGIQNRPLELVIRITQVGPHTQLESNWSALSKNMFPLLLVLCISGFLLLVTVLIVILTHQGCCKFIRNKAVLPDASRVRMKGVRYQPVALSENADAGASFTQGNSSAASATASIYNEHDDGINVLTSSDSRQQHKRLS